MVTIDDYVPCVDDKPIFTKPKGNEMWVLLLEKAFAKLVGSYAELEGGLALWALEAMTGDIASHFKLEADNKWQKSVLVHMEDKENKRKVGLRDVEGEKYSSNDFYAILKKYEGLDAAMSAYSRGTSDKEATKGIVEGHAYSILNVKEAGGMKFLELRNPWGTFSWEGAWSDNSDLWKQNPDVASALNFQIDTKDDGVFWMLFEDFMKHFDAIDILDREVDINDITFTIDEDDGRCFGPLKGCLVGCFRYWCLCAGCSHLCCPHHRSSETVKVNRCFCC
jgi:calpain-15